MVRAIIFDMDGTLLNAVKLHFKAWEKVGDEIGKKVSWKTFLKAVGETDIYCSKKFFPGKDPYKMREKKIRYYLKLLNKHGKLFPGVKRMLQKYHGTYEIMIASSEYDYVIDKVTEAFGLQEYVDYRIGKEDVTKHKPNPEIYNKCLKILKMKPDECVVVEDSLFGIEAAKRAGIKCIAVAQTHPKAKLKKAGADSVITKIRELKIKKEL